MGLSNRIVSTGPEVQSAAYDFFERRIDEAARTRSQDVIRNRSLEHTHYTIELILEIALKERLDVRISTGRLRPSVYDSVVQALIEAVKKNGSIVEIIICDADAAEFKNTERYKRFAGVGISIFFPKSRALGAKFSHFFTAGSEIYRFETSKIEQTGHVCFKCPSAVEMLNADFNEMRSKSEI
jgi:hypothetical protein